MNEKDQIELGHLSDVDLSRFYIAAGNEVSKRAGSLRGGPLPLREEQANQGAGQCATSEPYKVAKEESGRRGGVALDNVEDCFTYHPWSAHQHEKGDIVREALVHAVKTVLRNVPDSPDRAVAVRKIREARMDCNSAITHYGRF